MAGEKRQTAPRGAAGEAPLASEAVASTDDEAPRLTLMLPKKARVDDFELPPGEGAAPPARGLLAPPADASGPAPLGGATSGSEASLKADHASRPLWVSADGHIFLESRSPLHGIAQDFLTAIAEPVSRPLYIHEYKLTPYSLYAAVSVGLETENIVRVLGQLCKTPLSAGIVAFIRSCTLSYGKVKLVLHHNRYWIESAFPSVLQLLLRDPEVASCRLLQDTSKTAALPSGGGTRGLPEGAGGDGGKAEDPLALVRAAVAKDARVAPIDALVQLCDQQDALEAISASSRAGSTPSLQQPEGKASTAASGPDDLSDTDQAAIVHSFEVRPESVEAVKKRCIDLDYPMLEEYDFRQDDRNASLSIDLRPAIAIRPYQEKSLSKMFGNGRARSGIIVLPCGAGKTLVGITSICTVRKSALVLCTSAVAVEQWYQQLKLFTNIRESQLARFTSEHKEPFSSDAGIIISTYTMVAYGGRRSYEARKMMERIQGTEWGLLVLDEVHVVPANVFRRVLTTVAAHCKLGLTATLVREDDKIDDLNFLIGPKLYEANWLDLASQGHIATVQCAEVWCPMPGDFYREYLEESSRKRRLLATMNPHKFQACQYLIDFHERRGDKIIVFSDNVYALRSYALKLKRPHIYGETGQTERMRVLQLFQSSPLVNTIFLSKVGDTSIDLPEATCLIQISSHFGSRRQEAQRLGRILRAKKRHEEGFNAFFYSLVSRDTEEMYYSSKRQQFLIDQGYAFKVVTELQGMADFASLAYTTHREQNELLQAVLLTAEEEAEEEVIDGGDGDVEATIVRTKHASLGSLSGATDMAYMEHNRAVTSATLSSSSSKKARHPLFKARSASKR